MIIIWINENFRVYLGGGESACKMKQREKLDRVRGEAEKKRMALRLEMENLPWE